MNVREIIELWLREHGYDGLCGDDSFGEGCGCVIGDLMPCDSSGLKCKPGYKITCNKECGGKYDGCLGLYKNSKCPETE